MWPGLLLPLTPDKLNIKHVSCHFPVGLYELTHDNITENWRTINVLERMNIYQEVILSIVYRTLNAKVRI